MAKRAIFEVTVEGTNITPELTPVLIGMRVSDKVGTHSDSVDLEIDDTEARIVLPKKGAAVEVALGWEDEGLRTVFRGTVDEVQSSGSRSSGRRLMIVAKGMDTTRKPKEPQQRHWDFSSVSSILRDAGASAGVPNIQVDPSLAGITRAYFEMRDESFVAMGERLAREIGGNFRVVGNTAIMSRRNGDYQALVRAAWGENLHGWDIAPILGRTQFKAARSRWYDMKSALWRQGERGVDLDADATHTHRYSKPWASESAQQNNSDAATSERDAGEGTLVIEGNTSAIPDGLCIVSGTRPGVDGEYRIEAVTHSYDRSGGFVTTLELKQPRGGAGIDDR